MKNLISGFANNNQEKAAAVGLHDQSFSVKRMMPPGPVKYFFSVDGKNDLDEFAPTVNTVKNKREFEALT